jgi:hypothetical protein
LRRICKYIFYDAVKSTNPYPHALKNSIIDGKSEDISFAIHATVYAYFENPYHFTPVFLSTELIL